jgi:fumarate reductase (CoM/CoB) subunit B
MNNHHFTVRVYRFDPAVDAEGEYKRFRLDRGPRITVLELLKEIYRNHDPDLSFRWSCGLGKCGACAVRVNGRPVLACQTIVDNEDLTIEPLAGLPVVKDLIVDRNPYEVKLQSVRPFLDRGTDWYPDGPEKPVDTPRLKRLSTCLECLACVGACPVFETVAFDFAGPAVFAALSKWDANPADGTDRAALAMYSGLHNCTTCKSCSEVCPKGIDVFRDAIQSLRAVNAGKNRGLPQVQAQFGQSLSQTGNLFSPRGQTFTELEPRAAAAETTGQTVGLFLGCRIDARMQEYAGLLVSLLQKLGYRVVIPRDQQCCGGPLLWTGQTLWFETQVRANVGAFAAQKIDFLVTPCPGCGMVLKQDYQQLYEQVEGKPLPFKTVQVVEMIGERLENYTLQPVELAVTYHDPCHLNRGQHIMELPRRLLGSIPGLKLIEMQEASRCCGGMAVSANRHLVQTLAEKKAASIVATKAQAVVTSCPTCQDTIYKALVRHGHRLPVYMIEEIIGKSLGFNTGALGSPMNEQRRR